MRERAVEAEGICQRNENKGERGIEKGRQGVDKRVSRSTAIQAALKHAGNEDET